MVSLDEFTEAVVNRDMAKLAAMVDEVIHSNEFTVIKCHGCGEVVAFCNTGDLVKLAFQGGDPQVTYLAMDHMTRCKVHDVKVPLPHAEGRFLDLSKLLEKNLRSACKQHNRVYEVELPGQVERYREKAEIS